ncbi:MAG: ABC transporter permease [Anaerolineales bacterium]|nr:ABC transporter permease [Anaerolineales bacterium]
MNGTLSSARSVIGGICIWLTYGRYRDLIQLLVWRDFVAYYKQTILGPLWYIIQPVLTTVVFTVIFGNIAKLSTDGLPPFLFYMAGTTVWSYFSACLVSTSVSRSPSTTP